MIIDLNPTMTLVFWVVSILFSSIFVPKTRLRRPKNVLVVASRFSRVGRLANDIIPQDASRIFQSADRDGGSVISI